MHLPNPKLVNEIGILNQPLNTYYSLLVQGMFGIQGIELYRYAK